MRHNDEYYLKEAFSSLADLHSVLTEDAFPIEDEKKLDDLKAFVDDDKQEDEVEVVDVVDPEADAEADLQDTYVGKVILECECCHSRIYKGEADVVIDEETGLANMEDTCPVCGQDCGYTVIGKIEEFNAEANFEEPEEDNVELDSEGNPIGGEEEIEDEPEFSDEEIAAAFSDLEKEDQDKLERPQSNLLEKDDVCPNCGKNPCVCESKRGKGNKFKKVTEAFDKDDDDINVEPGEVILDNDDNAYPGEVRLHKDDSCNEELLDHGNENLGVSDEIAVKDDKSLEDDQKDLVKAADEKEPAINEGMSKTRFYLDGHSIVDGENGDHTIGEIWDDGSVEFNARGKKIDSPEIRKQLKRDLKPNDLYFESLTEGVQIDMNSRQVSADTDDVKVDVNNGTIEVGGAATGEGEMIAPLAPEDETSIEANAPVDDELGAPEDIIGDEEMPADDLGAEADANVEDDIGGGEEEVPEEEPEETEEEPDEEEPEEQELDEFDNETFNILSESFMRRVYENVKSYETTGIKMNDKTLVVEGMITFESGKQKATSFNFKESRISKRGKTILEGFNNTFSTKATAFKLVGLVENKVYIPESMSYSYRTTQLNEANESETIHICGRCVR